MAKKKLPLKERKWQAIDGSIFTADTDEVKVDFSQKVLHVRPAIAFNVGKSLAHYIVNLHNLTLNKP